MKLLSFTYLSLISLIIISCTSDPTRPKSTVAISPAAQQSNTVAQEERVITEPKTSSDTSPRERLRYKVKLKDAKAIAKHRASALNILNYRLKNDNSYMAMIEADTWEYAFVFDGEMSPLGVHDGIWIDFKKDHTYTYGKNNIIQGTGKYNYQLERGELLMIDDKPGTKPEEWTIKSADDTMIMVGTATYNDNHIQMKLVKTTDRIQQQTGG